MKFSVVLYLATGGPLEPSRIWNSYSPGGGGVGQSTTLMYVATVRFELPVEARPAVCVQKLCPAASVMVGTRFVYDDFHVNL